MVLCFFVSMFHYFHPFKRHSSKNYIVFLQVCMFHVVFFNTCHIFISCTSYMFYVLGLFLNSDFFILFIIDWLVGT
jgi:hypothetical protein